MRINNNGPQDFIKSIKQRVAWFCTPPPPCPGPFPGSIQKPPPLTKIQGGPQYFRLLEKWSKITKNSVISEKFRLRRALCWFYYARLLEKCSKFVKTFVIPENFRLRRAVLSISFQLIFNIWLHPLRGVARALIVTKCRCGPVTAAAGEKNLGGPPLDILGPPLGRKSVHKHALYCFNLRPG